MKTKLSIPNCLPLPLCGYTRPTLALFLYFLIGSSSGLYAQSQWYLRHRLPNGLLGATYGNGQFVAIGYSGTVLTSLDAVTWTSRLTERDGHLEDVAYGNGRFVAVGGQYPWDSTTVLTSTDGTVWRDGAPVNGFHLLRLVFANELFIGFGGTDSYEPVIVTSPDGVTWTERWRGKESSSSSWGSRAHKSVDVLVGNGTIVLKAPTLDSCEQQSFLVSTNSLSWVEVPVGLSDACIQSLHLSYGLGKFVAVVFADNPFVERPGSHKVLMSDDGFAWESLTIRENWGGESFELGFGNGSFVILTALPTIDSGGIAASCPSR